MIITVFVTTNSQDDQWRAELLEHYWQQSGQAGQLVRLVATAADDSLPVHGIARVVRTRPWIDHPYIVDSYAAYNIPAALLEWLMAEQVDATILVLEADSILLESINQELTPGQALGSSWADMPGGDGPFSLSENYSNLQAFCVNRDLKLARVRYPLLIHSSDLRKLAARWLELTGIIRLEVATASGKDVDADKVAYAIAAAEYRVSHKTRNMTLESSDKRSRRASLNYRKPVKSPKGKIVWDAESYQPWAICQPKQAAAGAGRMFLEYLLQYSSMRESGAHLNFRRPHRSQGVREAHVMDTVMLEIPEMSEPLTLNSSAANIWKLCDGIRTVGEIVDALEKQFEAPRQLLNTDVEMAVNQLRANGAIEMEIVD
jgi:hypothetical protein